MTFDRELFRKTFHSFNEVSPWLFPALAAENFLLAVRPFVVLHFSAAVVDGLYRGEGEAWVLLQALWLSCGVLAVEAAGHVLGCYVEKTKQRLLTEQTRKQLEKAVRMDYQLLESGKGQELLTNMKRGRFQHGDPFEKLIQHTGDMLSGLFGAVAQFFTGLTRVAAGMADLWGNAPFLRQHYEFLELEEPESGKEALPASDVVEISFEHVYFRYPGTEAWTLKDVSFRIAQGDHIAMVGKNGSGKTTCIWLLLRLYRPEKGVIRLNGVDIQAYDIEEYWRLLSVVFQDFKLFSFRLWQNIAGSGAKREEALWKALADMGMEQRVREMYAGTDSCLYREYDEQGILISGGEAQKLAIAKALYKDAPVFIVDEPSAALDPVSEAQLYEKTNTLLGEKTMIFISHRLSSCCFCDRILVLKDGVLLEEGSHEQLLRLGGEYQKLWEAQAVYYQAVY